MSEQQEYTLTLTKEQFELVQRLLVYEDMRFDNLKGIELPTTLLKERELKENLVLETLNVICQAKLNKNTPVPPPCEWCKHAYNRHDTTSIPGEQECKEPDCPCANYRLSDEQKPADSITVSSMMDLRGTGTTYLWSPLRQVYIKPTPCVTCQHAYTEHKITGLGDILEQHCNYCDCADYVLQDSEDNVSLNSATITSKGNPSVANPLQCACGHGASEHKQYANGGSGRCTLENCKYRCFQANLKV